jgi:hypothetical protein
MAVFQTAQAPASFATIKTVGRFVLHFVEMCVAMMAGMLVFMAVPGVMAPHPPCTSSAWRWP